MSKVWNVAIIFSCDLYAKFMTGWSRREKSKIKIQKFHECMLWQHRFWSFKSRDTKVERFLHKNQHTQRKLLNFENWTNEKQQ